MWYPLKNSVFSLSVASAVLMAVVVFGEPIDSAAPATATVAPIEQRAENFDAVAITLGATSLADRLSLESPAEREAARAALGAASMLLIAKLREQQAQIELDAVRLEAEAKEKLSDVAAATRNGRSGAAMPFFSFARWVAPGRERGS